MPSDLRQALFDHLLLRSYSVPREITGFGNGAINYNPLELKPNWKEEAVPFETRFKPYHPTKEFTIGRACETDFPINDPGLRNTHFRISWQSSLGLVVSSYGSGRLTYFTPDGEQTTDLSAENQRDESALFITPSDAQGYLDRLQKERRIRIGSLAFGQQITVLKDNQPTRVYGHSLDFVLIADGENTDRTHTVRYTTKESSKETITYPIPTIPPTPPKDESDVTKAYNIVHARTGKAASEDDETKAI